LENYSFADLLKDLETVNGLKRIRISSIEITELDEEVISVIRKSNKIVNHLHVPLQSGSNNILKAMNRKYTKEQYLEHINQLKANIKDLVLTTDIIVGFPGETEEDFQEQWDLIHQVDFQELHVFPFSKREGTVASRMPNQVNGMVKKERVKRLLALSEDLKKQYIQRQIGKLHRVIPEQMKDGFLQGHTRDYLLVRLIPDENLLGQEVNVIIKGYDGTYCYGDITK